MATYDIMSLPRSKRDNAAGCSLVKVSALSDVTPKFVWAGEALTPLNKSGGFCVMRLCGKCQEWKNLSEFGKGSGKDGLCNWCKACMAGYNRERRDSEEYKARQREWDKESKRRKRQEPGYKPPESDRYQRIKENEPERWRGILTRINDLKNIRRKTDPTFVASERAHRNNRKSQKQSGGEFTAQDWLDLCNRYDNRCLCCGEQKPLTVDHVIPLSKGGTNTIDNIQPLCLSCNSSKGAKEIDYR